MAAPMFMGACDIFWFFLQENLHAHKIPRCRSFFLVGGGEVSNLFFMGAGLFLIFVARTLTTVQIIMPGRAIINLNLENKDDANCQGAVALDSWRSTKGAHATVLHPLDLPS